MFVDWKKRKRNKTPDTPAATATTSTTTTNATTSTAATATSTTTTTTAEEDDDDQEDEPIPSPDLFHGFSFVSSRAQTKDSSITAALAVTNAPAPAHHHPSLSSSSSKLATVCVKFSVTIKQVAALPTFVSGHKVWVTWKCGKKRDNSGQTSRIQCSDRAATWSADGGGFAFELRVNLSLDEEAQEFLPKILELTLQAETGKIGKFQGTL